jgi:hypothetical protein
LGAGLGASTGGFAAAQGDTVCDNQLFNGTGSPVTGSQLNSLNPSLPYSSSCPSGIVWQDVGPQTQRGDVYAVQLGGFGAIASASAPATVMFVSEILQDIPFIGGNL